MKKLILIAAIVFLMLSGMAQAGSVTFTWDLSVDDQYLGQSGGYRLYVENAKQPGIYTKYEVKPGIATNSITLRTGNYSAALTAFDSDGLESDKTPAIKFAVPVGIPGNLKVLVITQQ